MSGDSETPRVDVTDPSPVVAVAHTSVSRTASALAAGDRVGDHHVIIRLLGAGGMGEVYLARDEKLARDVAVKLVHPALARSGQGDRAAPPKGGAEINFWRERLIREAQAMAQLNHPNIVAVHEVGAIGGEVFVAMEYVNGPSLRAWLAAEKRPWRAVVRAYLDCAAGLAAAHAARITHGDFKPDNVLVGADGRVRVTDFGLARAADDEGVARGGTPAYMAPELRAGGVATAASDQFALCTALRESLGDEPAWLRPILARGLAAEPAARWPSLAALISELGRDPGKRKRQLAIAGGAAGAIAIAAVIGWTGGHATPCDDLARELAGSWDPALRASAEQRFHATGLPYADTAFTNAAARLDGYATAWVAMRHDACMATAVSHEQSDAVLDLRMQCLDRRRGELATVSELFANAADKGIVQHALDEVRGLPAIADCADAASLGAVVPPAPDQRAAVAALRKRITSAEAAFRAGSYAGARKTADAAVTEARALGYAPVVAEALFVLAEADTGAGDPRAAEAAFRDAVPAAARARDDHTAALAALGLYHLVGAIESKLPEALALEPGTIAAVARLGDPPRLRAKLMIHVGELANRRNKLDEATHAIDEAIKIDRAPGADPIDLALALGARANVLRDAGDLAGSRAATLEVIALDRAQLGPEHPMVATALGALGQLAHMAGDLDEAERDLAQALAISERAVGKDHLDVARILNTLGTLQSARGELVAAHATLTRSLAIKRAALGDDHREVANAYTNLADVAYNRNDFVEARADNVRALAIYEAKLGPDHPKVAMAVYNLANIDLVTGHFADARANLHRAYDIYHKAQGDPGDASDALTQLAAVDLADHKLTEAAAEAAQALAARAEAHDDSSLGFATSLDLAASIASERGDHATALADCTRTLKLLETAGGPKAAQLAEPLLCLGKAQLGLGHPKEAIAPLERALAVWPAEQDAQTRGEIQLALARALESGDRAHALATAAVASLDPIAAAQPGAAAVRDAAKAWLAAH